MEHDQLPLKAKVYLTVLLLLSIIIIVHLINIMNWEKLDWPILLFFLFLTFLFDSFPVNMPRGGVVSVTFAITFALILIFEPLVVVIIVVLGDLLSLRKGRHLAKYIFNASQLVISSGVASLVYRHIYPFELELSFYSFFAALASLAICYLLNSTFVTLILAFVQNEKPYSLWLANMKWSVPNFLSMAPLGIIMAVIFVSAGFWGLILFLIPLTLARFSFQSYMNMRQTFLDTIQSLSLLIDAKDRYTRGHSSRVANYAAVLARELKWPENKVESLQYIAYIHDIGKIAIPEAILKKESNLSKEEFAKMKIHPKIGAKVVKDIKFFSDFSEVIRSHHERWDGAGYPDGLVGNDIPLGARILAVADAFDAMTSDRPYRKALGPSTALQEIREGAGTQFDPLVVEAFTRVFPDIIKMDTEFLYPPISLYGEQVAAAEEHD